MSQKVAVVTGSNKGIGFAIVKRLCQQFNGVVYLTARNVENGLKAIKNLESNGLNAKFHQLDVESQESIDKFRDYLNEKYGGIDVLINNAGVYIKVNDQVSAGKAARDTLSINYYGVLNVSKALFPLLRANSRVVNVASQLGVLSRVKDENLRQRILKSTKIEDLNQLADEYIKACDNGTFKQEGFPSTAYEMSKVLLIAATRIQQKEFNDDKLRTGIILNAVCPGYCATDLNDNSGYLTADQGAETPVYLTELGLESTNGGEFWSQKQKVDWETFVFNYEL